MPLGELRKELIATLRHAHNKRLRTAKEKIAEARSQTC